VREVFLNNRPIRLSNQYLVKPRQCRVRLTTGLLCTSLNTLSHKPKMILDYRLNFNASWIRYTQVQNLLTGEYFDNIRRYYASRINVYLLNFFGNSLRRTENGTRLKRVQPRYEYQWDLRSSRSFQRSMKKFFHRRTLLLVIVAAKISTRHRERLRTVRLWNSIRLHQIGFQASKI